MTGETPNETPLSQKDLDLRVNELPSDQKLLFFGSLVKRQVELMPEKKNVDLAEKYQIYWGVKNGLIKPEEEPKKGLYDDIDLEKFHEGGQSSLDSSPDVYELD